jgi:hypothetical protein
MQHIGMEEVKISNGRMAARYMSHVAGSSSSKATVTVEAEPTVVDSTFVSIRPSNP